MKHNNLFPDHNVSRPLQKPRYRVYYIVNNDNINIEESFAVDNNTYLQGEDVRILEWDKHKVYFSPDGTKAYKFSGWSFSTNGSIITEGIFNIPNFDVKMYAVWKEHQVFTLNSSGVLQLNQTFDNINIRGLLPSVYVPEYIGAYRTKVIPSHVFSDTYCPTILLPASVTTVEQDAFWSWYGTSIRFVDVPVSLKYPPLLIEAGAFENTPNLMDIILPYRWYYKNNSSAALFGSPADLGVKTGIMNIRIRNTKDFMRGTLTEEDGAVDMDSLIIDVADDGFGLIKRVYWGFND